MSTYPFLRQILFFLPPEFSHHITLKSLALLYRLKLIRSTKHTLHPQKVMGLQFPGYIGLGAGLDKNGDYIDALAALGFDFIEVGTLTPRAQPGNPKPRLFRLPHAKALINRMGFNNKGVDYFIQKIKRTKFQGILGVNIGKNFDTPLERASEDYLIGFQKVYPYASYVTINISSPNTPGLRQLQHGDELKGLLTALKKAQSELTAQHNKYVPLVVKISPDLDPAEIKNMAEIFLAHHIDGVIATNTTISREEMPTLKRRYCDYHRRCERVKRARQSRFLKDKRDKNRENYIIFFKTWIATVAALLRDDVLIFIEFTQQRFFSKRVTFCQKRFREKGGLSGPPLFFKSLATISQLHTHLQGKVPIIACGGIASADDAKQMLAAGASLLQIYTALIYQGAGVLKITQ